MLHRSKPPLRSRKCVKPSLPRPVCSRRPHAISNAELVAAFNAYVAEFNRENSQAIAQGSVTALEPSSPEFIEKASGVKARYVVEKAGILDPKLMRPVLPERTNDELSLLAEIAVKAAEEALARWGKPRERIGAVLCAASNMQRPYPAMAVEVQDALGLGGFAFDMNVACSSATFGIKTAVDYVATGSCDAVLMVNPEICSGHLNFRDRDSHFIFGDVATAVIVERADESVGGWEILGTRLRTQFSNNIRNNFGFLNRGAPEGRELPDKLFVQQGRKVFKEVVPLVSDMIMTHAADLGIQETTTLKRLSGCTPGQHQHERDDRPQGPGPRSEPRGKRHHPRRLRQHVLGGLDHRLP